MSNPALALLRDLVADRPGDVVIVAQDAYGTRTRMRVGVVNENWLIGEDYRTGLRVDVNVGRLRRFDILTAAAAAPKN